MGSSINLSGLSDYTRSKFDPEFAKKVRLADFGVEEFHPGHQDQTVHGARDPADATALADDTGAKKKPPVSNAAKASGGTVKEKMIKGGTLLYTSGTTPMYTDDLGVAMGRGTGDIVALSATRDLTLLVHMMGSAVDAESAAAGEDYDGVSHDRGEDAPDIHIFEYENLAYSATIKRGSYGFEALPDNWQELSVDEKQAFVKQAIKPTRG
jgi:hypothetical protein